MDTTLEEIRRFSDDQYSNENRLNARVQIYDFCEKKLNWREWVFDKLDFNNITRVLELGCGNSILWKDNIRKIPGDIHIVLSDISEGMVNTARNTLKEYQRQFRYITADACQTPFKDGNFQMIIANHMLYHIDDREGVLSEIDRLLSDDGFAYASTLSTTNLQELINVVIKFNECLELDDNIRIIQNFSLENGKRVLSDHFNVVQEYIYQNDILIKNAEPLMLYLASCYSLGKLEILISSLSAFHSYLDSVIKKNGKIRLTNKNVLFKFKKK